jgi:hypothetical protein
MSDANTRNPGSRRASRATLLALATALALSVLAVPATRAGEPVYKSWFGTAIRGYDPVAYFTDGHPVEGSSDFTFDWHGATWRFASAEHRDLFAADPQKYAPAYGGYCAYAVAKGDLVKTDPDAWKIVDGRLYLNYSPKIQQEWERDIPGYIEKADANWPGLAGNDDPDSSDERP